MRRSPRLLAPSLVVILVTMTSLSTGAQQGTPPPLENPQVGVLGTVQVDRLPSPDAEVWFLRFGLEPGASLPLELQIGPTVILVEDGTLVLETDQPIEVTGSGAEPIGAGEAETYRTVVDTDQTAYVREDTQLAARNESELPVTFLALLTFSPYRESAPTEAEAAGAPMAELRGITQQPLGVTRATFPDGPGTIIIERLVLEPNTIVRADLPDGATVGAVEQGSATVAVDTGMCFIWPAATMANAGESQEQAPGHGEIGAGTSADLATGDGCGCHNGAFSWEAGAGSATLIRAQVAPMNAATPVATSVGAAR